MDFGQLYMASPDWIKGLMVILPFLTLYGMARLFALRPSPSVPLAPAPVPPDASPRAAPVQRLHLKPIEELEAFEALEALEGPEAADAARYPVRQLDRER